MEVSRNRQSEALKEEERYAADLRDRRTAQGESIDELQQDQQKELDQLAKAHAKQLGEVRQAYKVELSREARDQQDKLRTQEKEFATTLSLREKEADLSFEKLAARERTRIESYKARQEESIGKIHKQFQDATDEMKRRNEV